MKYQENISIPMPELSPEAAYALADWISIVAHEVDLYYADHIRSYLEICEREKTEIEMEIYALREEYDEKQQEFNF